MQVKNVWKISWRVLFLLWGVYSKIKMVGAIFVLGVRDPPILETYFEVIYGAILVAAILAFFSARIGSVFLLGDTLIAVIMVLLSPNLHHASLTFFTDAREIIYGPLLGSLLLFLAWYVERRRVRSPAIGKAARNSVAWTGFAVGALVPMFWEIPSELLLHIREGWLISLYWGTVYFTCPFWVIHSLDAVLIVPVLNGVLYAGIVLGATFWIPRLPFSRRGRRQGLAN